MAKKLYDKVIITRPFHRDSYYSDGSAYQKLEFEFRSTQHFVPSLVVSFQRHDDKRGWSEWYGGNLNVTASCAKFARSAITFAAKAPLDNPWSLLVWCIDRKLTGVLPTENVRYFDPNYQGR